VPKQLLGKAVPKQLLGKAVPKQLLGKAVPKYPSGNKLSFTCLKFYIYSIL
jgi:hypothetical protein